MATKRRKITIPWREKHWIWILLFFVFFISIPITLTIVYWYTIQEVKMLGSALARPLRIGPVYARGIYMSSWTASEQKRVDELIDFILRTELNAVVIDIKDSTGRIAYNSDIDQAKEWGTREIRIKDISALLEKFQSRGIYTIARIVIFRDPVLAQVRPDLALKSKHTGKLWKDSGGTQWMDPASREVWAYNVALAQEALELGFGEVNFDYVRFPSDGNILDISFPVWDREVPRSEVIRQFFEYQAQALKHVGRRSVDIFGMTMMHSDTNYDMNIGQRFIDAVPYFNYISPMLYPSHFGDTFDDLDNPAEHPYEVISRSFEKTQEHIVVPLIEKNKPLPKIRPWIQAFDLGAVYTPEMITLQKQAVLEGGGYGWLLWNARNRYEHIEEALRKNQK
ncbi:putative glycoside hydrolase [Patescibacteria group bacterium AH-259-L07]|nr:putative glycoside hydrolase [Patescibacteria group bacterium AH-259-L07]